MNSDVMRKNHQLLQVNHSTSATADSIEESLPEERDDPSCQAWSIHIPDHVCVLEKFQMWIPLDRAVFVTRAVLHFLSEKQMTIILKHIESMAMFLSSHGVLEEPDGNHTVIRAVMRRFQEMNTERGIGSQQTPAVDSKTMVVNMDKLLQALVTYTSLRDPFLITSLGLLSSCLVELRVWRIDWYTLPHTFFDISASEQKKQFAQGDDNGDGVLSFKEFLQMMTTMAPQFPKRRVLRMFRFANRHSQQSPTNPIIGRL